MADKILLNGELHYFGEDALPCLVHYAPKMGGSHFSVTMIADLFLHGSKILFLTAYPMAKDNFYEQIAGMEAQTAFVTDVSQINLETQVIILESGNEELFLGSLKKLPDLKERVVLIKNLEVFSDAVFDACLDLDKIILSGDIDKCLAKKRISEKKYQNMIFFSRPETSFDMEFPVFEKYKGYLRSGDKDGVVTLQMENLAK